MERFGEDGADGPEDLFNSGMCRSCLCRAPGAGPARAAPASQTAMRKMIHTTPDAGFSNMTNSSDHTSRLMQNGVRGNLPVYAKGAAQSSMWR